MAWVTLTSEHLRGVFSAAELQALLSLDIDWATSPIVTGILSQLPGEIAGYIAASPSSEPGPVGTVPESLLQAALALARFRVLAAFPELNLVSEPRRIEADQARKQLEAVAAGKFIVDPAAGTGGTDTTAKIEAVEAQERYYTRDTLDGI